MVEVAELFFPLEGEEAEEMDDLVDGVASFWHSPSAAGSVFDAEIHHRHCFRRRHSSGARSWDGRSLFSCLTPRSSISISSGGFGLRIPSDSDSEADLFRERVAFGLELSDRCSPTRDGCGDSGREVDPCTNARDPFSFADFRELEEMSPGSMELKARLDSRFGDVKVEDDREDHGIVDLNEDEGSDWDGDELFFHRRSSALESSGRWGESLILRDDEGQRLQGFGSELCSGEEEEIAAVSRHSCGGDVLPPCWDCLPVDEDRRESNEDFEWEEIDERVIEGETLSAAIDPDHDESIVLDTSNLDLGFDMDEEQDASAQNIEWEVLLAMNTLERNSSIEHEDQDGFVHASEYDVLFGQFAENLNIRGAPPAAKSVIEHLPSVVLTQLDLSKNSNLCAVCKEEMSAEEEMKELPCSHQYHEQCILHWLRIRNTCPVCRHELPTDDPDYEKQRAQRSTESGILLDNPFAM